MKKLLLIEIEEERLIKTKDPGIKTDINELVKRELGWVRESGIILIDIMDLEDWDAESEDNWLHDMRDEEFYDKKSDLIELVLKAIDNDLIELGIENDILYQLLRSCSYKALLAYLPEDDKINFLKQKSQNENNQKN